MTQADWSVFTDEVLAEDIYMLAQEEAAYRDARQRREQELIRRLQERGARELAHPKLTVALDLGTPSYDMGTVRSGLGEIVPPEELREAWEEAREKVVQVPGRWNGTKLNALARKYGEPVRAVLERAKVPGAARLKITVKE